LQAADVDLTALAADLDAAIRLFMLGEGPQLGVNDIQHLDDTSVSGLAAQMHPAFLVNLDAVPEELAAAGLLEPAVYEQYKDLTLSLHRYLVDRVIMEWFARLRPTTKSNYLGAIHRVFERQFTCSPNACSCIGTSQPWRSRWNRCRHA
jgi:hypothetical protein